MKKPEDILKPLWDKWQHSNDLTSKELVALVWNEAISTSIDVFVNEKDNRKVLSKLSKLKFTHATSKTKHQSQA